MIGNRRSPVVHLWVFTAATAVVRLLGAVIALGGALLAVSFGEAAPAPTAFPGNAPATIFQAVLGDGDPSAPEISSIELKSLLAAGTGVVFDARPPMEFAMGHIPGARNVAPKAGVPMASYVSDVAAIGRELNQDKGRTIVLYCNGPFCGKSRRLAGELKAAGYKDVRRYQLGMPVWRALGEPAQIEPEGLRRVVLEDHTAVVIDARETPLFAAGSLPGSRNIPRSAVLAGKDVGVLKEAKNDGRLPMDDHNTRLIVVAANATDARFVAEQIAHEAFHNVSFFGGTFGEALTAAK